MLQHSGRSATGWLCAALLSLLPNWGIAGGFSVSPTTLEFKADQTAQGLRLHNSGERPINAQLRVFEWTQTNGEDVLTPSKSLVVSPPMATLAPGQQQFVRVVRLDAKPRAVEGSYRLLIDELPPPAPPPGAQVSGLNFVVRFSVPVFITPATSTPSSTRWSLQPTADGTLQLSGDNASAIHVQLADLRILDASGGELYQQNGLVGYVLGGTQRSWPLNSAPADLKNAKEIEARIDGQIRRQPLETSAR
ncbi:MAG: molecular chaperone [Pseudomonadota bacterium]|nr:molecular chaperone [Pseudomonadota bacterium]